MYPTLPIVNLNGDRRETLIEQAHNVHDAACKLIDALCQATPHGRNFQLNPDGDYTKAVNEMGAMLERAREVKGYYEDLAFALMGQSM